MNIETVKFFFMLFALFSIYLFCCITNSFQIQFNISFLRGIITFSKEIKWKKNPFSILVLQSKLFKHEGKFPLVAFFICKIFEIQHRLNARWTTRVHRSVQVYIYLKRTLMRGEPHRMTTKNPKNKNAIPAISLIHESN